MDTTDTPSDRPLGEEVETLLECQGLRGGASAADPQLRLHVLPLLVDAGLQQLCPLGLREPQQALGR